MAPAIADRAKARSSQKANKPVGRDQAEIKAAADRAEARSRTKDLLQRALPRERLINIDIMPMKSADRHR
jgi:hypothetical protein